MRESKMIKNISFDNFLYGGLIYHHKDVVDIDERNRILEETISASEGNATDNNVSIDNLYMLKEQLEFIKNSQSLTATAMQKTLDIINTDNKSKHPLDKVYNSESKEENVFVGDNIQIISGDIIIFLNHNGMLGDIYNHKIPNQKLCISYEYDVNLDIYVGRVFDQKLLEDFKEYSNKLKEVYNNA
ncbi:MULTISPECIES: hypothetical protein [Bacteria]|uniref:hypothetical protein n=1 Tax=Bacteria TaxID=2 RepID=UPI003F3CACFD